MSQHQTPFWARGGHAQTIAGHFLRSLTKIPDGEAVDIRLPDGDVLAADLITGTSDTLVYLFHGLGGSISAGYMRRTAKLCHGLGHSVLRVNHRGCGRGRLLSHKNPYHSGRAEDLSEAIRYGRARFPDHKHIAIGFSLSGNALLLLVSGARGEVLPDAAIAVNAPIDLSRASEMLTRGFLNRVYGFRFVKDCRRDVLHRQKMGWVAKTLKIPMLTDIPTFDDLYTAPAAGFKDRHDYYAQCSTAPLLNRIKIPTALITAKDDPFVPVQDYLDAKLSPSTTLKIAESGGHMGYLVRGAHGLSARHWLEDEVTETLKRFVG